jgi:hypothetical protein
MIKIIIILHLLVMIETSIDNSNRHILQWLFPELGNEYDKSM